jgi:hypothetical protein
VATDFEQQGAEAGEDFGEEFIASFQDQIKSLDKEITKAFKKAQLGGQSAFFKPTVKSVQLTKALIEEIPGALGKSLDQSLAEAKKSGLSAEEMTKILGLGSKDWEKEIRDAGLIESLEGALTGIQTAEGARTAAEMFAIQFGDVLGEDSEIFKKILDGFESVAKNLDLSELEKEFEQSVEQGISGALDFIPSNAFTQALGIDGGIKYIGEKLSKVMAEKGASIGEFFKKNWGTAVAAGVAIALVMALSSAVDDIGKEFGAIGVGQFKGDLMAANAEAAQLGLEFSDVAGTARSLSTDFGMSFQESIKLAGSVNDTAVALGISSDEAAGLVGMLGAVAGLSAEGAQNLLKQTEALASSVGVAPGAVIKDMANASEEVAKFTKDGGENMAIAAVNARQLGTNIGTVAKIAEGLLDFESSIKAEMETSVLIGRQLNLQRARQLALEGDLAGMMKEVVSQVGSEAEFNRLNVIQRESLAKSIGVSAEEMAKFVKFQGKSLAEQKSMRAMSIDELIGADAISDITLATNAIKALGLSIAAAVAGAINFMNVGGSLGGILQGIGIVLGVLAIGFGLFYVKGLLAAAAAKALGTAGTISAPGIAALGASSVSLVPILLSIALIGAVLAGVILAVGFAFKLVGQGISVAAQGLSVLVGAFTGLMEVLIEGGMTSIGVLFGMGLAVYGLSAALMALGVAGVIAGPTLAALTALGALGIIGGAVGLFGGPAEGGDTVQSVKDEAVVAALESVNNTINTALLGIPGATSREVVKALKSAGAGL